jgi:vacuolar-type H+-ATPase subunit I/STV1
MAKSKGYRANKANDSFGVVNNQNLYRGKYKDEVYKDEEDDAENVEASTDDTQPDPAPVAATQDANSFVSKSEPTEPEHDYKKRYDDLKKHYDTKLSEHKEELASLRKAMQERAVEMPRGVTPPRTQEELDEFKERYPDVFDVVQTVASMQTESQVSKLRDEIGTIKEREKELEKQKAYEELLRLHPDFDELKSTKEFLGWLEEQPATIAEGIYKNNTDAKWASRVVDLYKADTGLAKPKKKRQESAADAVTKTPAREVQTNPEAGKRVFKASQIAKMKPWEFEKMETEIDSARAEGRIDFNS